jgi:Family of unknown function (DUF6010)
VIRFPAVGIPAFIRWRFPESQEETNSVLCSTRLDFSDFQMMIFMAFKGLTNYKYIAVAWIFHTLFDIPHHFYAVPIDPSAPFSSAVCMIFDPLIAVWFYFGAPTAFDWFKSRTTMPVGS